MTGKNKKVTHIQRFLKNFYLIKIWRRKNKENIKINKSEVDLSLQQNQRLNEPKVLERIINVKE